VITYFFVLEPICFSVRLFLVANFGSSFDVFFTTLLSFGPRVFPFVAIAASFFIWKGKKLFLHSTVGWCDVTAAIYSRSVIADAPVSFGIFVDDQPQKIFLAALCVQWLLSGSRCSCGELKHRLARCKPLLRSGGNLSNFDERFLPCDCTLQHVSCTEPIPQHRVPKATTPMQFTPQTKREPRERHTGACRLLHKKELASLVNSKPS
jgi:hypothetical protein